MYTPITLLNNRSVCLQEDSKLSRGEVLVDFITVQNVHVCLGNRGFTITGVLKKNGQGQAYKGCGLTGVSVGEGCAKNG